MTRLIKKKHLSLAREILATIVTYLSGLRYVYSGFLKTDFLILRLLIHVDFECLQANKHGSLQIICEYYKLDFPPRGSTVIFHPLEHLHPLEFHRPRQRELYVSGSPLDLRSCKTSLEMVEVLRPFHVQINLEFTYNYQIDI